MVLRKLLILIFLPFVLRAQVGVVMHDAHKVDDCYRLISSRNLTAAHLLRPDGRYVHSWYYPATENPSRHISGFGMTWHYAEMLPNGHLLAIIKDGMILELDWNSNLVWKARLRAHHDFARTADGHTLVVSRRDIDDPWQPGKKIAMDDLVEFDENGKIVWRWQYEKHIDEIEQLVHQPLPPDKSFHDWPHINTCEVLPDNPTAKKDPRFKAENLLLSGRNANTIFIVDHKSGRVVWAWGPGELEGQHTPTMLKNGHILIFDNGQHLKKNSRGYTRIIEIEPLSGKIVWQYTALPKESFFSPSRGSANRLKNGNTLIAESDSGHLFEVTPKGKVVWEYWNSDLSKKGKRMALYRTVPYEKEIVDPLLKKFGKVKDVIPEEKESLKPEKFGPNHQYKRYIREVAFWTEIGYYDHALQFLKKFAQEYPNDPEGFYGYSLVYSAKKNPQESFKNMLKALDAGLPLSRFTAGPEKLFAPLLNSPSFQQFVADHGRLLVHGPMVGDVSDQSAKFWLRTFGEQPVQVIARESGSTDFDFRSKKAFTKKENEFTTILALDGLKPQTVYEYKLIVNYQQQPETFSFTTFPKQGESGKFLIGFGGGAGYTPQHEVMWNTILSHHPQFFLLLGDNVYIDHPERPGTQQFCYYRIQSRPEYRRFTGNTPIYAIWDDHDFTFNDGKGSPFVDKPAWKMDVWRLFKNQWNNPSYGGGEDHPGCWFDFSYGDVDFIMLDCRYYREQPKGNPAASMLGKFQKQWLLNKLKNSTATFKVLVSSVPWAKGTKPGSLDTWDGHPREREEIFKFIENNKIEGIVLLSADRHRSDVWRIKRPNGYNFYEFESSKLTNIHTHKVMPKALFGYNKKCSVGLLEFDTTRDDPQISYRILSIDNEEIYLRTVLKSDLSFKRQ